MVPLSFMPTSPSTRFSPVLTKRTFKALGGARSSLRQFHSDADGLLPMPAAPRDAKLEGAKRKESTQMNASSHLLLAYGTKHGSTQEVAESIAETLAASGHQVDVRAAADVRDLGGYDGVILGGALYMGRWHGDAVGFLERHRRALGTIPIAVFAMGPHTLADADVAGARAQLDRALAKVKDARLRRSRSSAASSTRPRCASR
jgi:sulfite reductase alpha subunit-like flavoprotein